MPPPPPPMMTMTTTMVLNRRRPSAGTEHAATTSCFHAPRECFSVHGEKRIIRQVGEKIPGRWPAGIARLTLILFPFAKQ